ncbi:hypothetical protein EVAR_72375_1 [Eumeta japonica]|uniref:Uncharacterized protein n=1 Tax=Eumeta variegata TaxID=151549 RepID=A0A4C1T1U3_EUMVA|nr:hypothetical protein EVAR_72375_1 [Eumeta japonica]
MEELLKDSTEIDLAIIDVENNTDLVETFEERQHRLATEPWTWPTVFLSSEQYVPDVVSVRALKMFCQGRSPEPEPPLKSRLSLGIRYGKYARLNFAKQVGTCSSSNGKVPQSKAYKITPQDQMSTSGPAYNLPDITSGAA